MVRKLTLMRHGEAETGMGYRKDFDRNLTMDGVNKLQRLNKVLQQRRTRFDFLITSPAVRAVQTSHWITYTLAVDDKAVNEAMYESSVETLLDILLLLPNRYEDILMVGHNPSISSLLGYLTDDHNITLSPGMMALVAFDLPEWNMLTKGSGSIYEVLQ
jgi:phosphohistidine phosphatase